MSRRTMTAIGAAFAADPRPRRLRQQRARRSAPPASAPAAERGRPEPPRHGACDESTDAGTVDGLDQGLRVHPAEITAKVGDVIAFTNGDTTAHTATLDDGSCTTAIIGAGATAALMFTRRRDLPVPLCHPLVDEGDDHGQLSLRRSGAPATSTDAPGRQVDEDRLRQPGGREPRAEPLARRRARCPGTARRAGRRR